MAGATNDHFAGQSGLGCKCKIDSVAETSTIKLMREAAVQFICGEEPLRAPSFLLLSVKGYRHTHGKTLEVVMLQLYYFPNNASLAPHLLLAETHVEYALRLVDRNSNAQKSKEYLKLNPAGRIPTLVHGDLVLFESPAICVYICELDAASQFIPPLGHPNRPLFFQWLAYLNNTLQAEFMLWRYPEKHTTDAKAIEGIKAAQDSRLMGILALLDEELGKKRFLLGDTVNACDHFLFMLALWCEKISRPPTSFANLLRFMREMSLRRAVQRVCEIENISLDRYSR